MSDFQKFCRVYFWSCGLLAAADNHHLLGPIKGGAAGITLCASAIAAAAIMWFGTRNAQ